MHDGRRFGECGAGWADVLHPDRLVFPVGVFFAAFAADSAAGALALERGLLHTHYLVGNAVGFMFERVVYIADCQLGLNEQRCRCVRCSGSGGLVKRKNRNFTETPLDAPSM